MSTNVSDLVRYAKLFADESRVKLLLLILTEAPNFDKDEDQPLAANTPLKLASLLHLAPSTVAHHLGILEDEALITHLNHGPHIYYFPNQQKLKTILETIGQLVYEGNPHKQESVVIKSSTKLNTEEFIKAVEFVALHDYLLAGPTTLSGDVNRLRFSLSPVRSNHLGSISLTFDHNKQEILLTYPTDKPGWIADGVGRIEDLIRKYLKGTRYR